MFASINEKIKISENTNSSEAIVNTRNEINELITEISNNPENAQEKMDELYDKIDTSKGVFKNVKEVLNELDAARDALEDYLANKEEESVTISPR